MTCKAVRWSDGTYHCAPCGYTWDADDEPPKCKPEDKPSAPKKSRPNRKGARRRRYIPVAHLPRS